MALHPLIAALIEAADLPSGEDPGHAKATQALVTLGSHVLELLERHVAAIERLAGTDQLGLARRDPFDDA